MEVRGRGIPKTDIQRVASHYGISEDEAERWLQIHPEEMLLPARGTGLIGGTAAGIENTGTALLIGGLLGAVVGGVIGAVIVCEVRGCFQESGKA